MDYNIDNISTLYKYTLNKVYTDTYKWEITKSIFDIGLVTLLKEFTKNPDAKFDVDKLEKSIDKLVDMESDIDENKVKADQVIEWSNTWLEGRLSGIIENMRHQIEAK